VRPVQFFSTDYLEQCRGVTPEQALTFLEEFRLLQQQKGHVKSKLISMKVPEPLLAAFRQRCEIEGVKYQTQIKKLMQAWVSNHDPTL
jgi:predicted DNA binding CopG/RHH family protein